MPSPDVVQNRTKIRLGLAIISAIFIGTVVMFLFVQDAIGKAVFASVALVLLVRMVLLFRGLRADAAALPAA